MCDSSTTDLVYYKHALWMVQKLHLISHAPLLFMKVLRFREFSVLPVKTAVDDVPHLQDTPSALLYESTE